MLFKEEYVKKITANRGLIIRWGAEIGIEPQTVTRRLGDKKHHRKLIFPASLSFLSKELGVPENEIIEPESAKV